MNTSNKNDFKNIKFLFLFQNYIYSKKNKDQSPRIGNFLEFFIDILNYFYLRISFNLFFNQYRPYDLKLVLKQFLLSVSLNTSGIYWTLILKIIVYFVLSKALISLIIIKHMQLPRNIFFLVFPMNYNILINNKNHMKYLGIFLIVLSLLLTAQSMDTDSARRFLQSTTRSYALPKMCAGGYNRNNLIDQAAKERAKVFKQSMKTAMGISGNDFLSNVFKSTDGVMTGLTAELPSVQTNLGIYIAPFILGLLILVIVFPFLCCCCCCPNTCPSKCCQKPDNEQYTKCELIWPSIVLIVALVTLVVGGAVGSGQGDELYLSYRTISCSIGYFFDDFLYGNFSSKGQYYIGTNNLHPAVKDLHMNLSLHKTRMQDLKFSSTSSPTYQVYQVGTNFLDKLTKIPNGAVNGAMTPFGYKHFDGTGNVGDVPSTFPDILGTTNPTAPKGVVNQTWSVVNQINQNIKLVGQSADKFLNLFPNYWVQLKILTSYEDVRDANDQFLKVDKNLAGGDGDMVSTLDSLMAHVGKIFIAISAVSIVLGVIGVLAVLLITFCDKYSCRYLLYAMCVVLFILGLVSFIFVIFFSLINPVMYFMCDFLQLSVSTAQTFNSNIRNAFPSKKDGDRAMPYFQVCLPGGTGAYAIPLGGLNYSYVIGNFTTVVKNIYAYNGAYLQTIVDSNMTNLKQTIDKYYYTDLFDFNSTTDFAIMTKIATPSQYTCTSNGFANDYWVPSIRQSNITCAGTSNASSTQCPSSTQIRAGSSASGSGGTCFGCMDSMKVLLNSGVSQSADITARYSGCSTWINDMNNLWTSYYDIKKTNYPPVQANYQTADTSYRTASVGFRDALIQMQTGADSKKTQYNTFPSLHDPVWGLVNGMNCLLLGEDILLIRDTLCTRMFNLATTMRPAFAIISLAILFIMFCTTCVGVRTFKHTQRSSGRSVINSKDIHIYDQATMEHIGRS